MDESHESTHRENPGTALSRRETIVGSVAALAGLSTARATETVDNEAWLKDDHEQCRR